MDDFILLTLPDGSRRVLYHHHTNSISGQQPDFYWEWACAGCGACFGNRDVVRLEAMVRAHVHEVPPD